MLSLSAARLSVCRVEAEEPTLFGENQGTACEANSLYTASLDRWGNCEGFASLWCCAEEISKVSCTSTCTVSRVESCTDTIAVTGPKPRTPTQPGHPSVGIGITAKAIRYCRHRSTVLSGLAGRRRRLHRSVQAYIKACRIHSRKGVHIILKRATGEGRILQRFMHTTCTDRPAVDRWLCGAL